MRPHWMLDGSNAHLTDHMFNVKRYSGRCGIVLAAVHHGKWGLSYQLSSVAKRQADSEQRTTTYQLPSWSDVANTPATANWLTQSNIQISRLFSLLVCLPIILKLVKCFTVALSSRQIKIIWLANFASNILAADVHVYLLLRQRQSCRHRWSTQTFRTVAIVNAADGNCCLHINIWHSIATRSFYRVVIH